MRVVEIDQNTDDWLELRKGKITGSKLKDIVVKRGTGKKVGFYQLIADKLALSPDNELAMDRGHRLEDEAIEKFEELTGKIVNKKAGMWFSEENEDIAVSPDGAIENDGEYTEAVEVKCLASARHLQAIIEDEIPDEYELQVLQYFIVNQELKRLYFVFYDPRVIAKPLHVVEIAREDYEQKIEFYKDYQLTTLKEVDELVAELAF